MIEKQRIYVWFTIGVMICIILAILATLIAATLVYLPIEKQLIYIIAPIIAGIFVGVGCIVMTLSRLDILSYWVDVAKNARPDVSFAIIYFVCLVSFIIYREPWTYTLSFILPSTLVYVLTRKYKPLEPLLVQIVLGFVIGYLTYYLVKFYSWLFMVTTTPLMMLTPYPKIYVSVERYGKFFDISIILGFFSILPFVACEEMAFRRVIKILSGFGLFESIFATQMVFLVIHALTRLDLPLYQYIHTFVCIAIAIVTTFYAYYRTGSVISSIIAHNTYNTLIYGEYLGIVTPISTLPYAITAFTIGILVAIFYVKKF